MSIFRNRMIPVLMLAVALVAAIGITTAVAAERSVITLTAVEGAVPNFENAVAGELVIMGNIDPELFDGQGVTAAK